MAHLQLLFRKPSMATSMGLRLIACAVTAGALLSAPASGQQIDDLLFSVSWRGPLAGSGAVSAGDILTPYQGVTAYQASAPMVARPASALGIYGSTDCQHGSGTSCGEEIDALSLGRDPRLPMDRFEDLALYFSVDRNAVGAGASLAPPRVTAQSAPYPPLRLPPRLRPEPASAPPLSRRSTTCVRPRS